MSYWKTSVEIIKGGYDEALNFATTVTWKTAKY